jgi:hypothetical protein
VTAGTDSHPNDPHVEALGRVRQVTLPRPHERSARSPTSTTRTPSSSKPARLQTARASNGPERSLKTLRRARETRSREGGLRSACGSVQHSLTDLCSAGRSGAAPRTSRSLAPAAASGCAANCSSNASSTRCSSPPSYNWRTASHAHCGPESRPGIDRSCGTSSSRSTARNGRANHEPRDCHRPSRPEEFT